METRELNITGIVQGVGFRWTSQMLAQKMNVKGTVKNESDGSVTMVIQGDKQLLDQFIASLSTSTSPSAQIDNISQKLLLNVDPLHGFHVLY